MNVRATPITPAEPVGHADPARLTSALAHHGLARFAALRLSAPDPLFEQLRADHDLAEQLGTGREDWRAACQALAGLAPTLQGPLGQLLRDFRLQLHEWFLLALAGELEASPHLALAVAQLQAPDRQPRPTLQLATALCAELFGAHLPPLQLPGHPLVRAGVLRLEGEGPLPLRSLAVPSALWAILAGDRTPWVGCRRLDPGPDAAHVELLPAALHVQLSPLADLLRAGRAQAVAFRGSVRTGRLAAARLAAMLGLWAVELAREQWEDEPVLAAACRYAGWLPVMAPRLGPGEQFVLPARMGLPVPVILALSREGAVDGPALVEVDIPLLSPSERRAIWRRALGEASPPPEAEGALLDGPSILTLAERALLDARRLNEPPDATHLARARAHLGAERLRVLAQPVPGRVAAEALILPPAVQGQFEDLIARCRRRERLWEGLGVTLAATANPGVRALFVGDSGTGKTLAAAHLATRLNAPLYRVDLAAVMNKYVGETEKNLGLMLDEAAASDVILLLDEADALFGRRSDGGESGERYANMLTNFLLTRIEGHPGIVILTSNSRSRIDPAFTRRLDAILEFPPPGGEERLRLWESHLGGRSPGDEVCRMLAAYCDLAGGHIRNAVLNAAARSERPPHEALEPALLAAALVDEYRKLGRDAPAQLRSIGQLGQAGRQGPGGR